VQVRAGRLAERLKAMTVGDVMTRAVVTARPEMPLAEAARLMHEGKIGALPVVASGRVVDVLKTFARALRHEFAKPERWALAFR
jgi:CBS domain-containing protein